MKIGIDIRTLMDAQYSGVPEYTNELLKEIFRLDKHNEYRLFYNSGRDVRDRMPQFKQENIEVVHSSWPNKIFNYLMQKALHYPKIDRLLGVDLFFMPHINFIALSGGCQKIITVHDLSFLRFREFFSWRKNIWHQSINAKKLLTKFDTVVAVSENTKNDIIDLLHIDAAKIKVIHSGINREFCILDKENSEVKHRLAKVRSKYRLPHRFLLYLGTLEPRKNVESVIEAFDLCRKQGLIPADIELVIAGGEGWRYRNIYRTWEAAEHKNMIHFSGYVDAADKVYLYNMAEVFVYPSYYEGFGFPPLEAMACGLPTVIGANSSLAEVAGKGAVMVDCHNIADISAAISQIIANIKFKNILQAQAKICVKRYSWEDTAKQYLAVFAK